MIERVAARLPVVRPSPWGSRPRDPAGLASQGAAPLPAGVNSLALIAAKVAGMGLGFLFWLLAARLASPSVVGLSAAAVSGMMLCTQLAILGLGSAVITHVRASQDRLPALLNSALTLVVGLGAALSLGFVVVTGVVMDQLDVVSASPTFTALFVAAAIFGTLGILLDQTATALRRGDQALVRNLAFGGGTLLGLAVSVLALPRLSSEAVFAPWAAAGALATVVGLWQLRRAVPAYRPRITVDRVLGRRLARSAGPNYLLTLAERTPGLLLPVLIVELLSPAANATWYGVWMMAWVVYIVPVQVGLTVFSEIANDPLAQDRAVRHGLRTSLGVGLPLAGAVALLADPLLGLLGEHYAAGGVTPLRLLVLGWIPLTVIHCYYAAARARRQMTEAISTAAVSAVLSISAAAVAGVLGGLTPMALAWLGVSSATGLWAVFRLVWAAPGGTAVRAVPPRLAQPGEQGSPTTTEPRGTPREPTTVLAWTLPIGALALFSTSLTGVSADGITDLGLASVLPVGYFAALVLLAVGFVLALRIDRERPLLLTMQTMVAIVLLYAVTLPFEEEPRFSVVYRHAGVIDHLLHGGAVDPGIDAYFNWPGFFMLSEFVVDVSGLDSALPIASYAPLAFNLIALPALLVIARAAVADWRTAWTGVWVFYLANWVGQDYLAPQAYGFLLYLTLAVALLTTLAGRFDARRRWWRRGAGHALAAVRRRIGTAPVLREVQPAPVTARERAGVVLGCVVLVAAMAASHQLTPFASLFMIVVLVLLRRTTAPLLPLVTSVLLMTWLGFMAVQYLDGHLDKLWRDALSLGTSVSANLGDRIAGSEEHLAIVYARVATAGVLWLLAAVGLVRMIRSGRWAPRHAVLALLPLVLFLLQPYGGEVLLRSYLFALPFVAVLVSSALFPERDGSWSWRRSTALLLVLCSLTGALLFTRYGNERANLYTQGEREAITFLYANAAPGDVVAGWSANLPWQDQRYDDLEFKVLSRLVDPPSRPLSPAGVARQVAAALDEERGRSNAYLLITRSQRAFDEMLGPPAWGSLADLEQGALSSPRFRLVHGNPDALVYVLEGAP